jgi:predicted nucleotidyltransferase
MMNLRRRFDSALHDTVIEWKKQKNVRGIFVYGSYARGTITANSDLDIGVIWDGDEAPVQLLTKHKEVLIDLIFMTVKEIEEVIDGRAQNAYRIAEIVGRLRGAKVQHDKRGALKTWQKTFTEYSWPANVVDGLLARAIGGLEDAKRYDEEGNSVCAVHELRSSLFDLGRTILMKNNMFCIIRASEVLTEVRMIDPMTYKLFLRMFKLRGFNEKQLLVILDEIKHWLEVAEERFEQTTVDELTTELLTQAQREYHGALNLTVSGDYELAVLEMQGATYMLGRALLATGGMPSMSRGCALVTQLRDNESIYFNQILVEYGELDFLPAAIKRGIGEALFIARRL